MSNAFQKMIIIPINEANFLMIVVKILNCTWERKKFPFLMINVR
jgi:hypothetical protein